MPHFPKTAFLVLWISFYPMAARANWLTQCLTAMGMMRPPANKADFKWTGSEISDAQWSYGVKRRRAWLKPGANLKVMGWADLLAMPGIKKEGDRSFYQGQLVEKNAGQEEADLIRRSQLDSDPHEIGRFTVMGEDGQRLVGASFDGQAGFVPLSQITAHFHDEIGSAQASGVKVKEIIFDHTHPLFDLVVKPSDSAGMALMGPLGGDDLNAAAELSRMVPYVVSIRAILPNGYSFKASFRAGQRIEPLPSTVLHQ